MISLADAVGMAMEARIDASQPLGTVVAGHNGSGKSTMWYRHVAPIMQTPLINADRMMMSILPEIAPGEALPDWAAALRDRDASWMRVAQKGVEAFVGQALRAQVPFAMETVFSHWQPRPDGTVDSKIDLIRTMQDAGYFVVLMFVGLANAQLSVARVATRVAQGGHDVAKDRLLQRFPRTRQAIAHALTVADTAILVDNSRTELHAFTVARVQMRNRCVFDIRDTSAGVPPEILAWMDAVAGGQQA